MPTQGECLKRKENAADASYLSFNRKITRGTKREGEEQRPGGGEGAKKNP